MAQDANICTRTHMKWGPAAASEPTSTLVLSSPAGRFVDMRILNAFLPHGYDVRNKPQPHASAPCIRLPASALDWAFAGRAVSEGVVDSPGVKRCRWTHEVDSRTALRGKPLADEGLVRPHPTREGLVLETGCMLNPASGREEGYEEVWEDLDVENVRGESFDQGAAVVRGSVVQLRCVVLTMDEESRKGVFICVGHWAQGVYRRVPVDSSSQEEFWATRWAYTADGWHCQYLAGPDPGAQAEAALLQPPFLFSMNPSTWTTQDLSRKADRKISWEGETWTYAEKVPPWF